MASPTLAAALDVIRQAGNDMVADGNAMVAQGNLLIASGNALAAAQFQPPIPADETSEIAIVDSTAAQIAAVRAQMQTVTGQMATVQAQADAAASKITNAQAVILVNQTPGTGNTTASQ